jgi:peptidoglycan/LPS O-acetylase OafA/YrhL
LTTAVAPALPAIARKPPLTALTGLRTLLALSIVFFHFTPPHLEMLSPVFDNGFVFVGFFFLLSGFILSYNYAERPTPLIKRDFWIARFSRLYPVYLVALAFSLQMLQSEWTARSRSEFFQGLLLTPLLLQGWLPNLATFWNTVAWTLSCEVMLYFAFPWIIRIPLPERPSRLIALLLTLWSRTPSTFCSIPTTSPPPPTATPAPSGFASSSTRRPPTSAPSSAASRSAGCTLGSTSAPNSAFCSPPPR